MNAREQKAALAETVRLTGIAPHDGETLREYLQRIAAGLHAWAELPDLKAGVAASCGQLAEIEG